MTPLAAKQKTTEELIAEVERNQAIQKQRPPSSTVWQEASEALDVLFSELAFRQEQGLC